MIGAHKNTHSHTLKHVTQQYGEREKEREREREREESFLAEEDWRRKFTFWRDAAKKKKKESQFLFSLSFNWFLSFFRSLSLFVLSLSLSLSSFSSLSNSLVSCTMQNGRLPKTTTIDPTSVV